jgi:hypothetical protein
LLIIVDAEAPMDEVSRRTDAELDAREDAP